MRAAPLTAVALAAAGIVIVWPAAAAPASGSPFDVPGRGAAVPFVEQEAESAQTSGTRIGPDRTKGTLAGEASGRQAVTLGSGQHVEFTLTRPANAVDFRFSVPDGSTSSVAVLLNGVRATSLPLQSKYAWRYGWYPYSNDPGQGRPHHLYDSTRTLFGQTLPAGAKVRLQNEGSQVTIDLADFEEVAPVAARPANSVSVVEHGATSGDGTDDANAFDAAVAAARAQGKEVWIPAGTFTVHRHVTLDQVTIRGAGHWHSVVRGNRVGFYGLGEPNSCGQGGNTGRSSRVGVHDFAIIGEVTDRVDCDQVNAIGGALGGGSVVSGMFLQHTKVGLWLDGPFDGLTVRNNRIVDQLADGLNLHDGISNVLVEHNLVRNISDDGLAMWSEHNADHSNTFRYNTIVVPMKANGIAIYGGRNITVSDNVVADTQDQGGGLHVGNRFQSVPVADTIRLHRNTTLRAGSLDSNWQFGVGALWFDARDQAMTGRVEVTDTDLVDSNYQAIGFISGTISNIHFDGVRITGAGTFGLQLQAPGGASFRNVTATGLGRQGRYNCMGDNAFAIADGGGNSGWDTTYCGPWPDPIYNAPPPTTTTTTTTSPPTGNLARGKPVTGSHVEIYQPANAVDGDPNTYWESTNHAFPQSITVDLGESRSTSRLVLTLPAHWGARTQTISVEGSNGGAYTTLKPSAPYTFSPNATVAFPATDQRYIRLTITTNTGWPAGQLSELEIYAQ
ncbi:mycodextranase [Lentzea tibetensis]|uniref:Mycodextranase n=1 Tax=Lentzea tibetensis TaxID=2591470 RepID=A0A563EYF7_9PSEU|nr:discoidin domain-containing protein [Lentzea tibetensis]TWP52653.1 mycodextranase [Lentzea tibetensis]